MKGERERKGTRDEVGGTRNRSTEAECSRRTVMRLGSERPAKVDACCGRKGLEQQSLKG